MLTVEEIVSAIKDVKTSVIKQSVMLSQPSIDRAKEGKMTVKTQYFLSEYVMGLVK